MEYLTFNIENEDISLGYAFFFPAVLNLTSKYIYVIHASANTDTYYSPHYLLGPNSDQKLS